MSDFRLKCNMCGKEYAYNCLNLSWINVSSHERSMGPEECNRAMLKDECSCGNGLVLLFNSWEYPIGADKEIETNVFGAEVIEYGSI